MLIKADVVKIDMNLIVCKIIQKIWPFKIFRKMLISVLNTHGLFTPGFLDVVVKK